MNMNFYKKCFVLSALLFISVFVSKSYAQWEFVKYQDAAYAGFVTKSGNLILSDFTFDNTGGIYISEDGGTTWTKTEAEDHCYNKFYQFGDYIFGIGYNAVIARSADEGKTWEMLSYREAADEVMEPGAVDWTVAYAMVEHNGKLFIGDFSGGGIMYSEDYGETWKRTDNESISYVVQEGNVESTYVENIYQLVSFNGKLYAFGVYFVFEYNEAGNDWIMVRDDSNFMSQSAITNGELYCGRSCMNDDKEAPILEKTSDFVNWTMIPGPDEIITRNVRVLTSDDKYVYIVTQDRGAFLYNIAEEKWYNICEGYPEKPMGEQGAVSKDIFYHAPTQMFTDDKYVYVVVYDVPGASEVAGLYRYEKSAIDEKTSIVNVEANEDYFIDAENIVFPGKNVTEANVYDVSGKQVIGGADADRIYIGNLEKGVYVFEAVVDGKNVRGKFAI